MFSNYVRARMDSRQRKTSDFERQGGTMKLNKIASFVGGTAQFRIVEHPDTDAPIYGFYSQTDLNDDLIGIESNEKERKTIQTKDAVNTVCEGDLIFSLISGTASIVSEASKGLLFTQNYVVIKLKDAINPRFMAYLLNKDKKIRKQLQLSLQGSNVLKYTMKELKELNIGTLPSVDRQSWIGDVYMKQLKVEALKIRIAQNNTELILTYLKERT